MRVYKVFFQILGKQKGQLILYLGIFLGIAMLLSVQELNEGNLTFEAASYSFVVFDEDDSEASRGLIRYLERNNEKIDIEDNKETIQDELYNRNIHCVLRIPDNFGKTLEGNDALEKLTVLSVPGTIYKQTFETLTTQYITLVRGYLAGGFSLDTALEKAEKMTDQQVSVTVDDGGSTTHSYLYYLFAYAPYILILLCTIGIVPVFIVFHKDAVKNRIQCSSYSLMRTNGELILGTVTAGLLFGVLFLLLCFALGRSAMLSFRGWLFALNVLSFLFVAMAIVFLLGQILRKNTVISMVSNVLSLGMSFLSGIFVPLEYLGDGIIRLAHFLPTYWYVLGVRFIDSYAGGEPITPLAQYIGIQILFAVALAALGLAYSKAKAGQKAHM